MKLAVEAGRLAFRAGRIPRRAHASASSPVEGRITPRSSRRREPRRSLMADHAVEPLEAVLRRLKQERDEADARYNDALTAVDRALRAPALIPQPPPTLDDHQLAALNESLEHHPGRRRTRAVSGSRRPGSSGASLAHICSASSRSTRCSSITSIAMRRRPAKAQRAAERTADALRDQLAARRAVSSAADRVFPAIHRLRGHEGIATQRVRPWS